MNYEINLEVPSVLPTTIVTKEEFDDYLNAVHNSFFRTKKVSKMVKAFSKNTDGDSMYYEFDTFYNIPVCINLDLIKKKTKKIVKSMKKPLISHKR